MKRLLLSVLIGMALSVGFAVGRPSPVTAGPTAAEKCEAFKLKQTGKYAACRLKAEAKAVKKGEAPDYTKCDEKIADRFDRAETKWGAACPTGSDVADIQSQATAATHFLALKLSGVRFVDNGDGTVTDTQTGLMWERKTTVVGSGVNPADPHDVDDLCTWSAAFTDFLETLNGGTSTGGVATTGCFAGHCDWRLPTIEELQTILLEPYPCGTAPCIDPAFGPTQSGVYWSATTDAGNAGLAWLVRFSDGGVLCAGKANYLYVRAVRGGL